MQDIEPEIVLLDTNTSNSYSSNSAAVPVHRAKVAAESAVAAIALSEDGSHLAVAVDLPAPALRICDTATVCITLGIRCAECMMPHQPVR